jgi:hypothetical protein
MTEHWRHLYWDGEFSPRDEIVAGLTRSQVVQRPAGAPHSIYEELWHLTKWQHLVVWGDQEGSAGWLNSEADFPSAGTADEPGWPALVAEFRAGLERALALGDAPEKLAAEVHPGVSLADVLHSLAVHNAYHLGKIVALRQMIGAWPPRGA